MSSLPRSVAFTLLDSLRRSFLRPFILRIFCRLHNSSYHWFSFFAAGIGPHPKHAITNYHQFFINNITATDCVIDLGCGHGELAYDLARHGRLVTGIDSNISSIAEAQQHYQRPNLSFIVGDIAALQAGEHYDVAILSNVLEHIEHRVELLEAIQHFADKILIRVPLLTRDWITAYKQQHGLEYRLDDTHFIEYSADSFYSEATAAGLNISAWHAAFGELYAVCQPLTPSQSVHRVSNQPPPPVPLAINHQPLPG